MHTLIKHLGRIKHLVAGTVLALGLMDVSHAAYTVPEHYRGNCPTGYYSLVTEPADVPAGYTGTVKEYALPSNVCVRRVEDKNKHVYENFSKNDFVVIDGDAASLFEPPTSGLFEKWDKYEPILGHYNKDHTYSDSSDPRSSYYRDYSGEHPVLVSKFANAALRVKRGIYLFDKQTSVGGFEGRCPPGYSKVGDSATCYSRRNGLGINSHDKLELIELGRFAKYTPDQRCPLGYAMANRLGSSRGICTAVRALEEGVQKFGIPATKNPPNCSGGSFSRDGVTCMPELTAIYCDMDSNAQSTFENYQYSTGRHVYYWPWTLANQTNALIEPSENYHNMTSGTVSIADLRKGIALFEQDDAHIAISAIDRDYGRFPVLRLYSGVTCDKLWGSGGWSMEPMPTFW